MLEALDGPQPKGFRPSYRDPQLVELERKAWLALRLQDIAGAEGHYITLLGVTVLPKEREHAFLALAEFYVAQRQRTKAVAVFEKFLDAFPHSPELPEVYLRLGMLYRSLEAHEQAVDHFFTVLKVAFVIPAEKIEVYRELSQRAKFEIAETYYRLDDLHLAADFFGRVARSTMVPEVQAEARLKKAYADLRMGNLGSVISNLERFPSDFTGLPIVPESRLVLARAHRRAGNPDAARTAVLNIMQEDLSPSRDPTWNYWLRTVGNELANQLFREGDVATAHAVYLALLEINAAPSWRWPIIFQVGLCLEQQDQTERARLLFARLKEEMDAPEPGRTPEEAARLALLSDRIARRLEHLDWQADFRARVHSVSERLPAAPTE